MHCVTVFCQHSTARFAWLLFGFFVVTTPVLVGCGPSEPALDVESQIAAVKSGKSTTITLPGSPGNEVYARLASLDSLKKVEIESANVTVEQIEQLSRCDALQHLVIHSKVDSEQLKAITLCKRLRVLNVPRGTFDDAAFGQLSALSNLELLRTGSPHLTDACLQEISKFPSLRFLHLIGAPVTDDGLTALHEASGLESFYIDDSQVTDAGIGKLIEARPGLHVHVNQQHPDRADGHSHEH